MPKPLSESYPQPAGILAPTLAQKPVQTLVKTLTNTLSKTCTCFCPNRISLLESYWLIPCHPIQNLNFQIWWTLQIIEYADFKWASNENVEQKKLTEIASFWLNPGMLEWRYVIMTYLWFNVRVFIIREIHGEIHGDKYSKEFEHKLKKIKLYHILFIFMWQC